MDRISRRACARTEFALGGWIAAVILSTLVWRLPTARERSAVLGFLLIFILLASAFQDRFGGEGLRCQNRYFETIADLEAAGLTLAVIRFGLLVDHYVVVERVEEGQVVVADPFRGHRSLTLEEFEIAWRHTGISLGR